MTIQLETFEVFSTFVQMFISFGRWISADLLNGSRFKIAFFPDTRSLCVALFLCRSWVVASGLFRYVVIFDRFWYKNTLKRKSLSTDANDTVTNRAFGQASHGHVDSKGRTWEI